MNHNFRAKVSHHAGGILVFLAVMGFGAPILAQTVYVVDPFDPSGTGANNYASGQITNVWGNWFGGAFQSLVWDSACDANTNAGSGSMKITASFTGSDGNSQFEVYDFNGIYPPVNGLQYTNFQCDVRFARGSATVNRYFRPLAIWHNRRLRPGLFWERGCSGRQYQLGACQPSHQCGERPQSAEHLQYPHSHLWALLQPWFERHFDPLGGQHQIYRPEPSDNQLRGELERCASKN